MGNVNPGKPQTPYCLPAQVGAAPDSVMILDSPGAGAVGVDTAAGPGALFLHVGEYMYGTSDNTLSKPVKTLAKLYYLDLGTLAAFSCLHMHHMY